MARMMVAVLAGLIASGANAAPVAQWLTSDPGDPYGAASIQQGRYPAALKRLTTAYARGERTPELLLNLAALNAKDGRQGTAHDLYREVLAQPDLSLVTLSGTQAAHDIARRGLSGTMTASR